MLSDIDKRKKPFNIFCDIKQNSYIIDRPSGLHPF